LKNGVILDRYSAPVVDKNGICYGRIWNFRDMTEQKRNQEVLQQHSLAVEQSPTSVVITDPQGNINYVNRKFTECTGYSPQEVLGQNPRVLNASECPAELYRDLWSTITEGKVWHGEFCKKKKNGEIYWESATITPITNPNGEIAHFLALKPCAKEMMAKTITAALMQYRLITAEKQLLEQTLSGCLQVLSEVLSLVNPAAFSRAERARRYIHHVVTAMKLGNPWQYEVAAILSQLGCVTLAPETIEAIYRGDTLSAAEQATVRHASESSLRTALQDPPAGTHRMDDRAPESFRVAG